MKLQEFVTCEREALRLFEIHWLQQHEKNPEDFPLELDSGEFMEQYIAWFNIKD